MFRKSLFPLLAVILVGSLELTTLPQALMEVLAGVTLVIVAVWILTQRQVFQIPKDIGIAIGVIWSIYIGHLVFDALSGTITTYSLIRVPLFFFALVVYLFLIPQTISRDTFLVLIARFGAALTPIGLIAMIVGGFSVGPLELSPWRATVPLIPGIGGPRVYAMTSIFTNPNMHSFICAVGIVAALGEFDTQRSITSFILIGLNGLGLLLSQSRAAMLGVGLAISMYVVYRIGSRQLSLATFCSGLFGILIMLSMKFGLLPPIEPIGDINLNNRLALWRRTFRTVSMSPIVGHGLVSNTGTHSAFLNQMLMAGLIGFFSYVYIYGRVLIEGILHATDRKSMNIHAVTAVLVITQAFQTYSFMGVTMLPAVTAIALGYSINEIITTKGSRTTILEMNSSSKRDQSLSSSAD